MYNNHSIARHIITKAVLPFVITLLLFGIFSCNKDSKDNDGPNLPADTSDIYIGTYKGLFTTPNFVYDQNGNVTNSGQIEYYNSIYEVTDNGDNRLTINYNGGTDVVLTANSTFSKNSFSGSLETTRWNLSIFYHPVDPIKDHLVMIPTLAKSNNVTELT